MAQELYELPEGWEWSGLGDHCQLENGDRGENYPSRSAFVDSGIPVINAGNLRDNGIDTTGLNYISRQRYDLLGGGKVRERDMLFCLRGSLGKSAIVEGISEGAIASSLVIVGPEPTLETKYLQAYFNSHLCALMIEKYDNGSAQPNLSSRSLKKFQIPLPPLNEQKRIVTKLDALFTRIDTAITHLQQTLELSKALFASALADEFQRLMKQTSLIPFGDVVVNHDGKRVPIKASERKTIHGTYPYYGATGIIDYVDDYIFDGERLLISEDGANLVARKYPIAFLATGKYWVNNHAHIVDAIPDIISNHFLEMFFAWTDLSGFITGAAQPKLSQKKLNGIVVPIPSLEEQRSIVAHLDALAERTRDLEAATQEKLNDLNALKASLLDAAFKGEL